MKKSLIIAALTCFATSAFAFSWSGIVNNNTKLSTPNFEDFALNQSNGIFLSFKTPINDNLRLAGEALYKYELNVTENDKDLKNIVDVDLLKLSGKWSMGTSNVALDFGRYSYSDLSSTVFNQCSDGLNVKYETAKWKTGLYAGYTGLLNSHNVSMSDAPEDDKELYNLCAGYVPVSVNFSYIMGKNVIGAQGSYFLGISDSVTDKIYGTVTLSGPVSTSGSYSAAAVIGFDDYSDLMLYAKADYSAYLAGKAMVGAGVEYASGDQGSFKPFKTISSKSVSCTGIPTSGVFVPKINAMYVANKMYASFCEKFVIAMDDSTEFAGADTAISVVYNIFSDLQLGGDIAAFVCEEEAGRYFSFTAKATLAF